MLEKQLGSRLRDLRTRRKRSLRALARDTGIALSFISAVENGRNSISVGKLKTLLDSLGTTLGEFFSDGAAPTPAKIVYRKAELVEISGQHKGLSYREVAPNRPGRALQLLVERYESGADTGPELYRHEAEEAGVVLKGQLELTVEDEVHVLGPGDAYYFDSRRPHRFRNVGRGEVESVSVNTPPSF